MKILVCVSRVPDTTSSIIINDDSLTVNLDNIKFIINPYDEFAIEEALQIASKLDAEVTAITVGTENSKDIMRTVLALGVHKAVIIQTEEENDSYSIAANISEYAKIHKPDLILTGRQSVDFDSMQIPVFLSAMLDMPMVSIVSKLDIADNKVIVHRDIENGKEVIQTQLPVIISTQKGINTPRYPKLPNILKAKKKTIEIIEFQNIEQRTEITDLQVLKQSRNAEILPNTNEGIEELLGIIKKNQI